MNFELNEHLKDLLERFLRIVKESVNIYFDADELEELLDYYDWEINSDDNYYTLALKYALEQYPNNIKFRIRNAKELIAIKKYDEALETIQDSISIEPTSEGYIALADVFRKKGFSSLEKQAYQDAVDYSTSKSDTYYDIAWVFFSDDKPEKAIYYFKKAFEHKPDNEELLRDLSLAFENSNMHEEWVEFFTDFTDKYPYSKEGWHQLGKGYDRLNLFEKAISALDFALAIVPNDSEVMLSKAFALKSLNRCKEALELLDDIPDVLFIEIIYFLRGECYEHLENYTQATVQYKKSIDEGFESAEIWQKLGIAYEKQGNKQEAIHCIKIAATMPIENVDTLMNIGLFLKKYEFYKEAINVFEDVIIIEPEHINALFEISDIYAIEGNHDKGILTLQKVLDDYKDKAEIYYQMAGQFFSAGKLKECYALLEIGLELDDEGYKFLFKKYPDMEKDSIILEIIEWGIEEDNND